MMSCVWQDLHSAVCMVVPVLPASLNCMCTTKLLSIWTCLHAGFPFVKAENYTPFLPFGIRGAFTGASVVFFSYIGFDTVRAARSSNARSLSNCMPACRQAGGVMAASVLFNPGA
jgi:hypothetical protein